MLNKKSTLLNKKVIIVYDSANNNQIIQYESMYAIFYAF